MAWIESHETLARHPKTKKLSRRLSESIPSVIGRLHMLWWWAMEYAQDGNLSKYDEEDIADAVIWEGEPSDFVEALVETGFLDEAEDALSIHDWNEYAGRLIEKREQNAERKRKSRERHKDVTRTSRGQADDDRESHRATVPNLTVPNSTEPKDPSGGDHAHTRGIVQGYEQEFGRPPNPTQVQDLVAWVDQGMETALVIQAMHKSRLIAKDLDYAIGILRKQYDRGIRTLAQAEIDDAKWQAAAGGGQANGTRDRPDKQYRRETARAAPKITSSATGVIGRVPPLRE